VGGPQSAAGYRAQGGPVSRGQPYVVGEQGPELFMPHMAGNVVPKGGMTHGGDPQYGAIYRQLIAGLRQSHSPKAAPDLAGRLARVRDSLQAGAGANPLMRAEGVVRVSLEGFPSKTRTTAKSAGFFKTINVDQGRAGPWGAMAEFG
jgi:hypothetical protein